MNIKFVLTCLVIALAISVEIPTEDGVLVLGENNIEQAFKDNVYLLVDFYAPWCGHCKKLTPEYAKAAQTLAKDSPPLSLGKVDATIHKNLQIKYKIEAYPSLKLFINGQPTDYTGGRTESDIVNWMRKKTGPATRALKNVEQVEKFKEGPNVSLVFFGSDNDVITKVARANEDLAFGQCNTKECFDNYDVKEGTLVLFKKFDEGRSNFVGELTETAVKSFIDVNSRPLAMKFNDKTAQLIFANNTPALILYRSEKAENTPELDRILKNVANKFKGKLQIVTTDIKQGLELRLADFIGVYSIDLPTIRLADTRTELKKYNFQGEMTEEHITRFVEDWETGKLRPFYKSQEIPVKPTEPVFTLVAKTFDEIVMDPTKDVLVEFYAPWCAHCKKLNPIYEELAKKYENNPNVVIAKIDATTNEIENMSIQGFPTIKFWPANNKINPIDFNEERNIESFTKFISVHGATSETQKQDL
jgi:protein disulfide-isomerase A1